MSCSRSRPPWLPTSALQRARPPRRCSFDVDGTSCSCPTFAGLVSLLNDIRLAAGKPTLGPLAQLLYRNAGAFTDVTEGSNPGCGTQGFQAARSRDPITGLGTPKFAALAALVKALP